MTTTPIPTLPVDGQEQTYPPSYPTYSTYWMPLDEPRAAWAAFGAEATRVPMLTATAHAFFALAHETKALRHFTYAADQQRHPRLAKEAEFWYRQAERALDDAAHNWSRAACALDSLTPAELARDELALVRTLSRQARIQQERLWKLTDEVRTAIAVYRAQMHAQRTPSSTPIPCLDQPPQVAEEVAQ